MLSDDPAAPGARVGDAAKSTRLPSVSRSLQFVAVLVFLVIVGVTYQQLAQLRITTVEETRRQMSQLDMVLAEQTGRAVDTVDFILRGAIERPANGEAPVTTEILRRRIMGVRAMLAIDVVDPAGHVTVSSRAAMDQTLPPAGQVLLQHLAADPKAGLLFSEPIHQADGTWTTLLARRIDGPDQSFAGIGVAWINLAYFEDFYKSVELDENGAIMLHRRDGLVLARYPHIDSVVGADYGGLSPFVDVLAHGIAGTVLMDGPVDHRTRILAIRALRTFPLAVNVSVDEGSVLASWRQQTTAFAGAAIASSLVVAALLFQLARRSREVETLLGDTRLAHDAAETANRDLLVQMEERERAEIALRQAQRVEAVGQLTGGVAHDFNNLLTVLLGNIDLMQAHAQAGAFTARLATMRAAAERGAALIGHLLAFARRQPLQPRSVGLGGLIRGMRPLLQSAVGSQITILLDLDEAAPPARVDPTQIELVILNLAINARDAMPLGGTLRLKVFARSLPASDVADAPLAGDYVAIGVTDTGTGMSPEVLSRAFEPYFTTKPPGIGSGLGLSQVYGVARQSGGVARIESSPGVGTTVEVLLPRALQAEAAAEPAPAPAPIPSSGRATLLVVDDDSDVRSTTALLLRRMGYKVVEASGAEQALQVLEENGAIELLLSDVVMPQTSGPELARKARERRQALPVVFFSGYADPEAIAGAAPLTRLLRKPFRPADLVTMIETALSEARAEAVASA